MALIKLSSNLDDIKGSIGQLNYSKVRSGNVSKTKSQPGSVNPFTPSASQIQKRNFFRASLAAWRTLTIEQVTAWNDLAKTIKTQNVFGESYFKSGYNTFMEFNQNLQIIGSSVITDAPVNPSVLQLSAINLSIAAGYPDTFTINFTGQTTDINTYYLIFATAGLSAGRTYSKNKFRLVGIIPPSTADSYEFYTGYSAIFPEPAQGSKVQIYIKPISGVSGIAGTIVKDFDIMPINLLNPMNYPNLIHAFRAWDISLNDEQSVDSWPNAVDAAKPLVMLSGNDGPTITLENFNGKKSVKFVAPQVLDMLNLLPLPSSFSILLVCSKILTGVNAKLFSSKGAGICNLLGITTGGDSHHSPPIPDNIEFGNNFITLQGSPANDSNGNAFVFIYNGAVSSVWDGSGELTAGDVGNHNPDNNLLNTLDPSYPPSQFAIREIYIFSGAIDNQYISKFNQMCFGAYGIPYSG